MFRFSVIPFLPKIKVLILVIRKMSEYAGITLPFSVFDDMI